MLLRPLQRDDLETLVELLGRIAPFHRRWSAADLRTQIDDPARGRGAHVAVAEVGGRVAGMAAWVDIGAAAGEFYGSPVVADCEEVAAALIARVADEGRAAGAAWVRISAWPEETAKRAALERAGFRPVESMVTLDRKPPAGATAPPVPDGLSPVADERFDAAAFAEVHNLAFADVPQAPAIDVAIAAHTWGADDVRRELWQDAAGVYQAFIIVTVDGEVAEVAVRPSAQGRGLGGRLLDRALAGAAALGMPRVHALIAASNAASLALHRRRGFIERERLTVFQRELAE